MSTKTSILIVDDNATLRKTLSDILKAKAYATTAVATGEEALEKAEKEPSTVALIDLKLDGMSGLELMKRIKVEHPETECIVITGHASKASAIEAINLGAYSYVQKPYDMDQLVVAIRRAVEKRQTEIALQKNEEQLRTLIDAMPDFVCFKDGNGRWLKANDASIRIFQLESIDYRGKKDSELAELSSFLRNTFLTCKKSDANTWKTRSIFRGEETISLHDGIVRVFDVIKVPVFYPSGERKGLVVLGRDITERKRAEEEVRLQLITLAETVSRIFNLRNPYVATHQQETARLARAVGEKMGLDEDTLRCLYIGSLLHDIGKTAIPEGILRKPGKLTEEEWGLVRTHPQAGYEVLKDANLPTLVAELALQHHERLDGSGYPDGLKGDELGLEVRILAVCNVVNAMSLRHPYRPARSKQEIIEEIMTGKGTRYDPDVVDVLVEMIKSGKLELESNG